MRAQVKAWVWGTRAKSPASLCRAVSHRLPRGKVSNEAQLHRMTITIEIDSVCELSQFSEGAPRLALYISIISEISAA